MTVNRAQMNGRKVAPYSLECTKSCRIASSCPMSFSLLILLLLFSLENYSNSNSNAVFLVDGLILPLAEQQEQQRRGRAVLPTSDTTAPGVRTFQRPSASAPFPLEQPELATTGGGLAPARRRDLERVRADDRWYDRGMLGNRQRSGYYVDDYDNNGYRSGNTVQGGGSRSTWSNPNTYGYGGGPQVVDLSSSDGRPIQAEIETWEGPGNTPARMRVYSEDGRLRPFRAEVGDRAAGGYGYGYGAASSAVSVRNTGPYAFPIQANVRNAGGGASTMAGRGTAIQGGSLRTFPVDSYSTPSVVVELESNGLPIQAEIEVWEGPGQARQVAEIYVDDGARRPCRTVIPTPGFGSGTTTIAVRNVGPMTFPFTARVVPNAVGVGGSSYYSNNNNYYDNNYGSTDMDGFSGGRRRRRPGYNFYDYSDNSMYGNGYYDNYRYDGGSSMNNNNGGPLARYQQRRRQMPQPMMQQTPQPARAFSSSNNDNWFRVG